MITTIAGTGVSGFSGDGGPATQAQLLGPSAILLDGAGGLLVSDSRRIRRIDLASGTIDTIAGNGADAGTPSGDAGPARNATLFPGPLALDGAGNLFVADSFPSTIRRIDALTGIITSVAGGGAIYTGDGGPATAAQFRSFGITFDRSGNLYIADALHGNVRVVKRLGVPLSQ
jgi:hypothetical protein